MADSCGTVIYQLQKGRNMKALGVSQPGIYCVERLREPYQSQLQQHLDSLSHSRV